MPNTINYIRRPSYIDKVKPFINKELIKVFTGQRRVGKSYLLYQIMDIIKEMYPDSKQIYINKELDEFSEITNSTTLLNYIKPFKKDGSPIFLFIDEIQEIKEFEKALRSLNAEGGYDIYCTGSNAYMLSGELATFLSGRYIEIEVFGLSYSEFIEFHRLNNHKDSLIKYLQFGGLPYLIHLPLDEHIIYDYLKSIYNTILYKDVIKRFNIRNIDFLEKLVKFLCDNTGSLFTAKKISDFLKNQKINISTQVIINYLSYLESSFIIYRIRRMDIAGKKIFEIGEKFYFEDLGLRNTIIGFKTTDIHKHIENTVYFHLLRCGYKVFIGYSNDKEIDFIGEKKGEKIYIQACYLLSNESTINREFGNLLAIPDNYPKYVISMDDYTGTSTYQGIKHLNLIEFLSNEHI